MKKSLIILLIGCLSGILIDLTAVALCTYQAIAALRQGNLTRAGQRAQTGLKFIQPLSQLTFQLIPDLETWRVGLSLITQTNLLAEHIQPYTQHIFEPLAQNDAQKLTSALNQLAATNTELVKNYDHSYLISHLVKSTQFDQLNSLTNDLNQFAQTLLTGRHRYLIVLQNSHELRASGGFMGTYAKVVLDAGQITEFDIQDIYEPDGQFHGRAEPPPGVAEYLSSGKGLRLPDANWHPDFPTTSRQILDFFALGKKEQLEGVAAINLSLGENLLNITGPIYLPDYQMTVTADNLAEVARADRDNFFPGSQQKPDFFSHLFTQLKLKLESLSPLQQQELIKLLIKSLTTKDIQLFATDEQLQQIFVKNRVAGQLLRADDSYLYLVESNVGINKANQRVTREVNVELNDYRTTLSINFHNQNSDLNYINYQRLIVPTNCSIHQLIFNKQKITQFDESMIKNSSGDEFKQIGFLVTVPANQSQMLVIELTNDQFTQPVNPSLKLFIQKQPGLPPTPYSIKYQDQTKDVLLEQDTLVKISL